jgi:hypothetical protein
MRIKAWIAAAGALLVAGTAQAACEADVQVDVSTSLLTGPPRFVRPIPPGDARVVGRITPQRGRETVRVELGFDYRIPEDLIALDEIVCEILVEIVDDAGEVLARSLIDPDSIHLNPNRVPLFFATTLYTGEGTGVRVRIRGNYE